LTAEPWCWPLQWVELLTDEEVIRIIEAQVAVSKAAQPDEPDQPEPESIQEPVKEEPGRKGFAWEFLVANGVPEAEADKLISKRR